MKVNLIATFLVFLSFMQIHAQKIIVSEKKDFGYFPIATISGSTAIYVDEKDHWLMHRAAELFRQDLEMLTGQRAEIISAFPAIRLITS